MQRLLAILALAGSMLGLAACTGGSNGAGFVPSRNGMDVGVPLSKKDVGVPLSKKDIGVPLLK